ncbi:MAG: hypothetical protein IPJ77_05385 [Planctomycetes bacterium]|nr:hypothetical protein [Planctomycetota bacterium]
MTGIDVLRAALHDQLLDQALHLAVKAPHRPLQASVRRSISASYYALFHFLVRESAGAHAGQGRRWRAHRDLLGRTFKHGEMAEASKAFLRGWARLPLGVQRTIPDSRLHPGVVQVADTFVKLQEARHAADYDTACRFARETAVSHARSVRTAIRAWPSPAKEPSARAYLACLLCWLRVVAR